MKQPTRPSFIFDLDGTLADTLEDITASLNHALSSQGAARFGPHEVRPWVGEGLPNLIMRASGRVDADFVQQAVTRFRQHYAEHCLERTRLYPGWRAALDGLAARGAAMCVLSNKPDRFTRQICAALLGGWRFVEFAGQKEGVPLKPDPTAALALCQAMGADPRSAWFVGDSPIDIQTARRAGMSCAVVTWGLCMLDDLRAAGPDRIVSEPAELLTLAAR